MCISNSLDAFERREIKECGLFAEVISRFGIVCGRRYRKCK